MEALTPASAQDGGASVRLHARAATDLGLLRASRLNHVCTEEPIAEDEELALAVRAPAAEAERACLTCSASGRPARASASGDPVMHSATSLCKLWVVEAPRRCMR